MGYLLKEALKALCGVNEWSYAVFWKIGCQNPKLLIWEESYYGSSPSVPLNSSIGNQEINLQKVEGFNNETQLSDKVHLLMDRMMMSNHVNVVGEGYALLVIFAFLGLIIHTTVDKCKLVGRAAFTGSHQWIVSGMYNEIAHPAEVLNEVHLQFSAGMKTIAVIPVIPHGVVQLGSSLTIMENVGFVHDVRSFLLQLGCIPSAFISDNYFAKDAASMLGLPVADATANPINLHRQPTQINSHDIAAGGFNLQRNSSDIHGLVNQSSNCLLTQFQDNLQVSGSIFTMPNPIQDSCKGKGVHDASMVTPIVHSNVLPVSNRSTQGVVMPLKSDLAMKQSSSNNPGLGISCPQSTVNCWHPTSSKQLIVSHEGSVKGKYNTSTSVFNPNERHHAALNQTDAPLSAKNKLDIDIDGGHSFQTSPCANMVVQDTDSSIEDVANLLKSDNSSTPSNLKGVLNHGNYTKDSALTATYIHGKLNDRCEVLETHPRKQVHQSGGFTCDNICIGNYVQPSNNSVLEDIFLQSSAGDDLFDVLGVHLKNKLLNGNTINLPTSFCAISENQTKDLPKSVNQQNLGSEVYSDYEGISESVVFSSSGSDHLLDAVISGTGSVTKQISDDDASCKTAVSKISSSSVPSTPQNNPNLSGLFNMSDRMQGQLFGLAKPISRLVEPVGNSVRSASGKNDDGSCTYGSQISSWIEQGPSTSVSTANSKKSDGGKSNRKRLKPGENPRPRPKDRQMIQDRVKELREIVPNGAKCSIDSLLERTIKHMLFLQSVTKHADKLKQTVESKVAKKEGGMPLKDEFQSSATWAFELGSQSLVCPIVVEDLNLPRQLLIEMLCEERGFFLEIADIIRGLGLTILKGIMEARNDKIWARFAVEANRDVTRMEVFISLVHLLEQTLKGSTSSVHSTNDDNMAVLPVSIPAPIVCGEPSM
ncbi:transcription factor LHW-like isoform X1 [Chenopodium quinoa]|uniref:transcription factor LHW-like isoform X1 n=1 Tax=Chenopodium quinoa TaxID=63459 RepID=UPI000B792D0C|nr:transcription factor LHW-like isoform X1 [Chenopodium quinoa]